MADTPFHNNVHIGVFLEAPHTHYCKVCVMLVENMALVDDTAVLLPLSEGIKPGPVQAKMDAPAFYLILPEYFDPGCPKVFFPKNDSSQKAWSNCKSQILHLL